MADDDKGESSGKQKELTDEQRQHIEMKRKEALAKLSRKRKLEQPTSFVPNAAGCGEISCELCGNTHNQLDKTLLSAFELRVCLQCKRETNEFDLITCEDVKKEYLLPDGTIRTLRVHKKPNPRNSSWAPIKLYVRREAIRRSLERWGNFEILETERRRRLTSAEEKKVANKTSAGSRNVGPYFKTYKGSVLRD